MESSGLRKIGAFLLPFVKKLPRKVKYWRFTKNNLEKVL
nr:MAG TPA: hypothetical protein [Caudoviricetes sp.]